ncbi:MAG: hypothetical protein Q9218_008183, partial [Villophora microphyllina]
LKDALSTTSESGLVKGRRDLWTRLATSQRGMTGVNDLRRAGERVVMFLFPWDERMTTELEYRVFCCPILGPDDDVLGKGREGEGGLNVGVRMAAISQYKWHAPWFHGHKTVAERQAVAERLVLNCQRLFKQTVSEPSFMATGLKERGFVFDVVEDPATQAVRLIELNEFGAMTGCGSCLFQWIRDAKVLYGREREVE